MDGYPQSNPDMGLVNELSTMLDDIDKGAAPGQATEAPEVTPQQDADNAAGNADTKGQADKAPEGQAEPAPEGTEKQAEPTGAAKEYTKEEIAELEQKAKSYEEAHPALTKAQQEAAALRKEIAALKEAQQRPQTEEEYVNEALRDAKFIAALEAKGYKADSFFDENGVLTKNIATFGKERASYLADQRVSNERMHNELSAAADERRAILDGFKAEYGEGYTAIEDKVKDYIRENYDLNALLTVPVKDVKLIFENVVRSIDPKLFERADMAKEAARIEAAKEAAAMSGASPKNPKGDVPDGTDDKTAGYVADLDKAFKSLGALT